MLRNRIAGLTATTLVTLLAIHSTNTQADWLNWRGPLHTGVSPDGTPPTNWSANQNIKWKAQIPGNGNASPVVVGDHILIQTAVPVGNEQRFMLMAYNRNTGSIAWQKDLHQQAPVAGVRQNDGTYASHSPFTDGQKIWAYFGSYGIYCLDMQGNTLWSKQLSAMRKRNEFGEGTSPVVHNNTLILLRDHEGDSHIIALNASTGEEIWSKPRNERSSWSTPLITEVNGRAQVIVPATNACIAYDLESGDTIWTSPGLTANVIPSPMLEDGILYLMSGFRGNELQAIDLAQASGNIANSGAILWTYGEQTPYTPSPVVYNGVLYFLAGNNGVLTALDAKTGQVVIPTQRTAVRSAFASMVAANGHVYISGRDGEVLVIRAGRSFEQVALNRLDDKFDASPAISGSQLFLRGPNTLYCIEQ